MKSLRFVLIASSFLAATPGFASDREFAEIYTDCGLGALIAPRSDAVAAVTNVTWDSGTTAISSDSSSPESCKGGKETAAAFILDAYPSLEADLARGSGEHLATLIHIAGCQRAVEPDVAAALRADFSGVASEEAYTLRTRYENAERLFDVLTSRIATSYASSCAIG